jgi:hypothetical protein
VSDKDTPILIGLLLVLEELPPELPQAVARRAIAPMLATARH